MCEMEAASDVTGWRLELGFQVNSEERFPSGDQRGNSPRAAQRLSKQPSVFAVRTSVSGEGLSEQTFCSSG